MVEKAQAKYVVQNVVFSMIDMYMHSVAHVLLTCKSLSRSDEHGSQSAQEQISLV